jgi:RimJ/RimL family protein N-acetyltransferase
MNERLTIAPILETERLILRPHSASDFPDCMAMWQNPQVVRYTLGSESPPRRTWLLLLAYQAATNQESQLLLARDRPPGTT